MTHDVVKYDRRDYINDHTHANTWLICVKLAMLRLNQWINPRQAVFAPNNGNANAQKYVLWTVITQYVMHIVSFSLKPVAHIQFWYSRQFYGVHI